jgi:biopolymer transport protein ExbB|tara:strand:- start:2983 stop:3507 length:525 start_codon:yes stop_codon:yes gene_type:complete
MQFFYNFSDALFAFMQRGGDVLYLIGLLAFVMWFLIFERMWFYYLTHKNYLGISVAEWETRQDKGSWNSKAIRDMLISENAIRIDQNLSLIKMCVGIAPLFGLFGTITGMIEVFHLLAVTGGGDAKAMAGGVSRSTIPAMAGLAVALTGTLANQFLVNKAQKEKDLLVDRLVAE